MTVTRARRFITAEIAPLDLAERFDLVGLPPTKNGYLPARLRDADLLLWLKAEQIAECLFEEAA